MLYANLSDQHIEQLRPFIQQIVKTEVDKALADYSKLYEQHLKRVENVKFSSIKVLCKTIGKSRQQIYNWETGKVHGINISGYVRKVGRYKEYDVNGIKLYLKRKDENERFGSPRFPNPTI